MSDADTKKGSPVVENHEAVEEYPLDHSTARPNRFAERFCEDSAVAVVLDADVAEVFDSSESVNRFLRSAIQAMPPRPPAKAR